MIDCDKERAEMEAELKKEKRKKKPDKERIYHINERIAVIDRLEAVRNLDEDCYFWTLELEFNDSEPSTHVPLKAGKDRQAAVKECERILKKEKNVAVARLYQVKLEKEFKVNNGS